MKLISMIDFVLKHDKMAPYSQSGKFRAQIAAYAEFMKLPLEENMFVVPPGKFDPTKTILFNGFSPEKYPQGNNLLVSVDDNVLMIKTTDPSGWCLSFNLKFKTNNIEKLFLQLDEWNVPLTLSYNAIAKIFN